MKYSGVDPYLVSRLGYPKSAGGLEVRFDCFCEECKSARSSGKTDPKLYVNFSKNVFYCMRSSWGGPLKKLYESLGIIYSGQELKAPSNLRSEIGFLDPEIENVEVKESGIDIPWTEEFKTFSESTLWLGNRLRTVPTVEIERLVNTGVIRRGGGRYWDRVFFVDMYNKVARYWTARTYIDGFTPKYLNPFNVPRSKVLGNQDRVEEEYQDEVIICEGPISAIVAGPNAVWTYGRCVTSDQIHLLDSLSCSRFLIVSEPDADAKQNTLELARKLVQTRREVYIVDMPTETIEGKVVQHDPASLGRDVFRKLVEENAIKYSWYSEVERRVKVLC